MLVARLGYDAYCYALGSAGSLLLHFDDAHGTSSFCFIFYIRLGALHSLHAGWNHCYRRPLVFW